MIPSTRPSDEQPERRYHVEFDVVDTYDDEDVLTPDAIWANIEPEETGGLKVENWKVARVSPVPAEDGAPAYRCFGCATELAIHSQFYTKAGDHLEYIQGKRSADKIRFLCARCGERYQWTEQGELEPRTAAASTPDYVAITANWDKTNARRHELIAAKQTRDLSPAEAAEFLELQRLAGLKREMLTAAASTPAGKERNVSPQCWRDNHEACECSWLICHCECHKAESVTPSDFTEEAQTDHDAELSRVLNSLASELPAGVHTAAAIRIKQIFYDALTSAHITGVSQGFSDAVERAARLEAGVYMDFESQTINGHSKHIADRVCRMYQAAIRTLAPTATIGEENQEAKTPEGLERSCVNGE